MFFMYADHQRAFWYIIQVRMRRDRHTNECDYFTNTKQIFQDRISAFLNTRLRKVKSDFGLGFCLEVAPEGMPARLSAPCPT